MERFSAGRFIPFSVVRVSQGECIIAPGFLRFDKTGLYAIDEFVTCCNYSSHLGCSGRLLPGFTWAAQAQAIARPGLYACRACVIRYHRIVYRYILSSTTLSGQPAPINIAFSMFPEKVFSIIWLYDEGMLYALII